MNTRSFMRREFADTRAVTGIPGATASLRYGQVDAIEQMSRADQADWTLLRLVLCSAAATLLLALACSLVA